MLESTENQGRFPSSQGVMEGRTLERNCVDLMKLPNKADGLGGRSKDDMAEANPWSREEEATRKTLNHLLERLENHFGKGKELNEATRKRRDRAIAKIAECEARLAQLAMQRRVALKKRQIEAAMDALYDLCGRIEAAVDSLAEKEAGMVDGERRLSEPYRLAAKVEPLLEQIRRLKAEAKSMTLDSLDAKGAAAAPTVEDGAAAAPAVEDGAAAAVEKDEANLAD